MTHDNPTHMTKTTVIGFGLICGLFCLVGVISWIEITSLGSLTSTIYKHPLEVSNAALRASMGVVKMHRSMKDVVLSDEQLPLETAINYVEDEERIIMKKLDVIQEKILGTEGLILVKETRRLFVNWKPIREEVIDLVKKDDKKNAARITKGKGALHEAILEQKMLALTSYARGKADGFIEQANNLQERVFYSISISVAVGFFMSLIIAVITSRKLSTALNMHDIAVTEKEKLESQLRQALQVQADKLETAVAERTSELLKAKIFLEGVLENIEDGIVACDKEGVLSLFNRATEIFHGHEQQQLPPDKWATHYDLFLADGKTLMNMEDIPLFRAFQGEEVKDIEMVIAPKKGKKRFLLATGRALFDDTGLKYGAVVSMHDITEKKLAEDFLKKAHEELEIKVKERTKELQKALAEVKTLRGILPLCSYCKKVRDDSGYWEQVDVYIHKHSDADISHSICQECLKQHHPEEFNSLMSKGKIQD